MKTLLACLLVLGACAHAQTNLTTPVIVLPKADGSGPGELRLCDQTVKSACPTYGDIGIQGNNAFRIGGRSASNGDILLAPGNVPTLASVFVLAPRTDTPGLIVEQSSTLDSINLSNLTIYATKGNIAADLSWALATNLGYGLLKLGNSTGAGGVDGVGDMLLADTITGARILLADLGNNTVDTLGPNGLKVASTFVTSGAINLYGGSSNAPEITVADSGRLVDIVTNGIIGNRSGVPVFSMDSVSGGRIQLSTASGTLIDQMDIGGLSITSSAVTSGLISVLGGTNAPEFRIASSTNYIDMVTNSMTGTHLGTTVWSLDQVSGGRLLTYTSGGTQVNQLDPNGAQHKVGTFTTNIGNPASGIGATMVDSGTTKQLNMASGTVYDTTVSTTNLWWALASNGSGGLLRLADGSGAGGIDGLGSFILMNSSGLTTTAAVDTATLQVTGISGSTQCLQANSSGVVSGTGAVCGGSGSSFQVNGTPLSSSGTVNFQNSSAFNGLTVTFANPSAGNVQLGLSGALTSAGMTSLGTSGTFGSSTFIPQITIDSAGRISGVTQLAIGACSVCITTAGGQTIAGTLTVNGNFTFGGNLLNTGVTAGFLGSIVVATGASISGNVGATGFIANGNTGVTCSGLPTVSFATNNGIVIHC